MSKIIVYSQEGFGGQPAEFQHDVSDLAAEGFKDSIASIKVIGQPWVAYHDKSFAGKQRVFEEGEYATLDDKGQFSSLKWVTADLTHPEITLFEQVNYQGKSVSLNKETNLKDTELSNTASSHKVRSGVWVLYEYAGCQGSQLIAYPGDQVPSYVPLSFSSVTRCVRPLLPRP